MYSEAQKQLFLYQREMVSAASRTSAPGGESPASPKLAPLTSPGLPVTPLELEREEGYLVAGARNSGQDALEANDLVDSLIREEARRRRVSHSPARHGG